VGFLATAVVPGAVATAEVLEAVELLDAAASVPLAAVLGILALWLARGARIRSERTLGRVGGTGSARAGRILGALGLCIAASGAIALVTYYALSRFAE
jgi:hypothetical protein